MVIVSADGVTVEYDRVNPVVLRGKRDLISQISESVNHFMEYQLNKMIYAKGAVRRTELPKLRRAMRNARRSFLNSAHRCPMSLNKRILRLAHQMVREAIVCTLSTSWCEVLECVWARHRTELNAEIQGAAGLPVRIYR